MVTGHLKESRTGRNVQYQLLPLLRQAVYSRLAGYEATNPSAEGPSGWPRTRPCASSRVPTSRDTNSMSRFETEVRTRPWRGWYA